jgi:hypothetical protein
LPRLQHLDVNDLPRLERFDADTLARLRILTSLRIQTWPRIEKYRFRLGSVLSSVPSLRKLSVRLRETSLTDQLLGAFNTKLRHLEVTGENLRTIDADAFEGQFQHQFSLAGCILVTPALDQYSVTFLSTRSDERFSFACVAKETKVPSRLFSQREN